MPGRWRVKDPFSLDRKLIRMSWDPKNLINLIDKKRAIDLSKKTVYQQKWEAKKQLRAYHVPNISERQFLDRHFKSYLPNKLHNKSSRDKLTPIQAIMFGELERRVDVVVFRSHFAKSIWHARQLVVKGHVKINGEKTIHPAQSLEDGDMITVDPNYVVTLRKSEDGKPHEFKAVDYMSPWMFIPTYLEVCYATCSTVFLRAPLVQPRIMEIPSPYPPSWHQLVFEWYASIKRSQTKKPILPRLVVSGRQVKLKPKFDSILRMDTERKHKSKVLERRRAALAKLKQEKDKYAKHGHL